MPGLLEGQIAKAIYAGFKGRLLKGKLYRTPAPSSVDGLGDPIPSTPTIHNIQGFWDEYSRFDRAQGGIPDTDSKVCIFAQSIPGLEPISTDVIHFPSKGWFQVRTVRVDPATALWECQSFLRPALAESG